jgi:magnesium-transporting ATPase (P-type)
VNFQDETFWDHLSYPGHPNYANIEAVLLHLALCHTIVIDERTRRYNASSPDELALVNAAKHFGAEFIKRDEENNMIVKLQGREVRYRLMNILEFNSTRKRMSVIVEDPQGRYLLLTKGADSIIKERLNMHASQHLSETQKHVDVFAEEGLRTLFLAQRYLTSEEYMMWSYKFEQAMQTVSNRDEAVAQVNEEIEVGLELIGSTAIEDKLQDGVPDTIRFIREAGVKVWVLTGDKVETAINIGYSSGLIDNNMIQYHVTGASAHDILDQLNEALRSLKGILGV